jgi:hypothetical protein
MLSTFQMQVHGTGRRFAAEAGGTAAASSRTDLAVGSLVGQALNRLYRFVGFRRLLLLGCSSRPRLPIGTVSFAVLFSRAVRQHP